MQPQPKNRPDRPSFRPRHLASRRIPQDRIAGLMGVSPKTVRQHLRRELTPGATESNLAILSALHQTAGSGKRKHLAAAISWAKSRCAFQPIYSQSNHLYIYRREKPSAILSVSTPFNPPSPGLRPKREVQA